MWQAQDAYYLFVDCEKSLPVRHLDINMVRLPLVIWFVLEFVKTLLSKKIRQASRGVHAGSKNYPRPRKVSGVFSKETRNLYLKYSKKKQKNSDEK